MPVFPSMVYMLLEMEQAHRTDFSSLRHALCAGSPMSPDRLEEAIKVFGDVFHQGYGQTEALVITWLHPQEQSLETPEGRRRIASCGKPVLGVHVRLLDDSGSDVPDGEVGEICVRSPYTMREYWRRPDDTAKAFEGGWLHTGDMGRVDENGYYYIVDRKKDMIITGAYNVYSQEIEDVLTEHPAIAEAAVIGVPDAKWGEAVKACVVLHRGAEVDAQEIIAFVRERKGPVQAPKSVEFLDYMPLTQALKADKKLLRARYWEGQGRQVH
jgi:fatty-acyl-CoA synthase